MQHGWPALYTLLLWWFSTGLILYLNGLPRATNPWTFASATVLLGIALVGVSVSASDTRVTGAYLAFTAALMVWAWQEIGFLLGRQREAGHVVVIVYVVPITHDGFHLPVRASNACAFCPKGDIPGSNT